MKDRLRAMRGLRSVATGQRVLEAVEAAQAVRRGDLCHTPRAPGAVATLPAAERARAHAFTFLFVAQALRLPGYPPQTA